MDKLRSVAGNSGMVEDKNLVKSRMQAKWSSSNAGTAMANDDDGTKSMSEFWKWTVP